MSTNPVLTTLGKYLIKHELGNGALGMIYEGFDPFEIRSVTIKTIKKSLIDPSSVRESLGALRREAQAASRLAHPNIASVYDYGEDGDLAFIVFEHIVGITMGNYFETGKRFQIKESVNYMTQLLDALDFAHTRSVVHRDIKPSNLTISKGGQLKIADFGIAKIQPSDITLAGIDLDSSSYASPEQLVGSERDCRSDIYSAGIIFYHFLAGERPFSGNDISVVKQKVLNEQPVPLHHFDGNLPASLTEIVMKAIARKPEDRFQTAAEFLNALKSAVQISDTGVTTTKDSAAEQTPPSSNATHGTDTNSAFNEKNTPKNPSPPNVNQVGMESSALQGTAPKATALSASNPETSSHFTPLPTIDLSLLAEPSNVPSPKADESSKATTKSAPSFNSGLLNTLAIAAKEKQDAKQAVVQFNSAKNQQVHDTLGRLIEFFDPFIENVNHVEPTINRIYHLDTGAKYTNLKWKSASVDFRKQNTSDSALLDNITVTINLSAAGGPILVKQPWGQLDDLRKELFNLNLSTFEDINAMGRAWQEGFFQVNLVPDFSVYLRIQGNYSQGKIDLSFRNVEKFGVTDFKLEPEDVTPEFMDGLGLFLLGNTEKLPAPLQQA